MKTLVFKNKLLNGGFTQVPNEILYNAKISLQARFLFNLLLSYAWTKDQVFPGKETLAKIMNCSDDTVHRYLLELKDVGIINWKRRGLGKTNIYTIMDWSNYQIRTLKSRVQQPSNLGFSNPSPIGTNNTKTNNTKREGATHPAASQGNTTKSGVGKEVGGKHNPSGIEEEKARFNKAITYDLINSVLKENPDLPKDKTNLKKIALKCFYTKYKNNQVPADWEATIHYWFITERKYYE